MGVRAAIVGRVEGGGTECTSTSYFVAVSPTRMPECRVRACRFKATHTTAGHRCGSCGLYGHGILECGKRDAIQRLKESFLQAERVDHPCTVEECTHPWTHVMEAHHCGRCGERGGGCGCGEKKKCPLCRLVSGVDVERPVHTGGECCVCMEAKPCVVFEACRHATVCADCASRL